jgi:hypothetical protein
VDSRVGLDDFENILDPAGTRDSAVGTATGYGLDDRGGRSSESLTGHEFTLHHVAQPGSGDHPTSYPMGTGGSFPKGKTAGSSS